MAVTFILKPGSCCAKRKGIPMMHPASIEISTIVCVDYISVPHTHTHTHTHTHIHTHTHTHTQTHTHTHTHTRTHTHTHTHQGTSARAGAALINQILVLPVGQGQNLKS